MSDRYHLQRSIVYLKAVMIGPEAGRRMEVDFTDGALKERAPRVLPSTTAVHASAQPDPLFRPMADEASVYDCRGCRLYGGAVGGIGCGYLHQELLAEGHHARLSVVLQTPQLVGVDDAHIE